MGAISSTGSKTQRLPPENLTRTQTWKFRLVAPSQKWWGKRMVVHKSSQAWEHPALCQIVLSASTVRSAAAESAQPPSFSPASTDRGVGSTRTSVSGQEQTTVNIQCQSMFLFIP